MSQFMAVPDIPWSIEGTNDSDLNIWNASTIVLFPGLCERGWEQGKSVELSNKILLSKCPMFSIYFNLHYTCTQVQTPV